MEYLMRTGFLAFSAETAVYLPKYGEFEAEIFGL